MDDYELKLEETLEGHTDRVWCVRWHPNGKILATSSADRTIRIWGKEGDKWVCLNTLTDAHQRTIRSIAWSHDGRFLSSASFDGTTCIWQRKSSRSDDSEEKLDWTVIFSLEGHENEVKGTDWSPDDSFLATCSRDKSVWIWEKIELKEESNHGDVLKSPNDCEEDEAIFECASVQTEHSQDVKCVVWHPKFNILASSSFDNTINLYCQGDDDWYNFAVLDEHESTVWSMDFNASGTRIVSVSADESIKIWQPQQYQTLNTVNPLTVKKYAELCTKWTIVASLSSYHRWPIYDVSWSPLNNCILTGGGDNSLHIFKEFSNGCDSDESTKSYSSITRYRQICFKSEAHEQDINSVHWNPKQSEQTIDILASASDDGFVRIWKLNLIKEN